MKKIITLRFVLKLQRSFHLGCWRSLIALVAIMLVPQAKAAVGDSFTDENFTYIVLTEEGTIGTVSVGMQSTSIPSGAVTIPASVSNGDISYSVVKLRDSAFDSCTNLTSIIIPDRVTYIGEYAFDGCSSLTSIEIPDSVTYIGSCAFSFCSNLTSVVIPNSVGAIWTYAFSSCTRLRTVQIGNGVNTIDGLAFVDCVRLEEIKVSEENPNFCDIDGVLFSRDKTVLVIYPGGRKGGYIIPDGVTTIGADAFANCERLTSIVIPDSVITIEECAFYSCTYLSSVVVGNNLATIGKKAFFRCLSLTTLVLPESVSSIKYLAFYCCSYLTSVYFKGDAPTLDEWSFGFASPTIYYVEGTEGWTNPWNGYPTETWIPPESFKIKIASVEIVDGKTIMTLTYTGTLQWSEDMKNWQDVEDATTGTEEAYTVDTSLNALRLYRLKKYIESKNQKLDKLGKN